MLRFLNGLIVKKEPGKLLLQCGFAGIEVHFPEISLSRIGSAGEEVRIYTELILRARESDGEIEIFGFADMQQHRLFKLLLTVSKVGPKLAMSVLSQHEFTKIITAITESDWKTLAQTSGLGEKTSKRIIVELKDRIAKEFSLQKSGEILDEPEDNDLFSALKTLGYSRQEFRHASSRCDLSGLSLEEKIRVILGVMAK